MHQTDHHSTATSSSGSFKVFYSDLDLWALTVDQLKQHMKDLGIYHGCSHLRKEELIEKIKEFNHLVEEHHHDHHGEKRKHNDSEIKKEESPKKEKVSDDILEEDLLHPHSFSSLSISKKEEPAEVAATTHHHISTSGSSSHKSKEHRKRRFVSSCPIKTQERIERALTQK